ncbi:NAD+ synthase [Alicyclobacillaceae bacterium I2511]|nr:NAD+ synthase [Alicyclobacillaceae bacterium I2511]
MKPEIAHQLAINVELTAAVLTSFIREETEKSGFQRVVMGLSGGIDSAVAAYLAVAALGADNVRAVMMPYQTSSVQSLQDAQAVVADLGLAALVVDISAPVDAYFGHLEVLLGRSGDNLRRGNRMARERMATLFDLSAYWHALVLGTSNKTELLLGYGTQFGDLASAVNPIGDLYKTQLRQLAEYLRVPMSIREKPPSADLWANQTDEMELGFTYEEADEILFQWVDLRQSPAELVAAGAREAVVREIVRRVAQNQYKRQPPVIAKVSTRTVGIDFRYLRDWGR